MIRYWVKLPAPGQVRGEGDWIECVTATARNHWQIPAKRHLKFAAAARVKEALNA